MSDIKSLREISNDPFGKLLTALSKKFSAFLAKDQAELVENPEDIYADGQDVESALKFHNFVMSKSFDLQTTYYSSADPDLNYLRLWIIGRSLGNDLRDYSETGKLIKLYGDANLVDGAPLDWGIADSTSETKSVAMRLNRPTSQLVNREYIKVLAEGTISLPVSALVTGKSYFVRFRLFSLAQQGGVNRTLFEKIDDATPNDGVVASISTDGKVRFHMKRSGTEYNKQTAPGTITTDTVYDVCCTFDQPTKVIHIYINGVDMTLTDAGTPTWQTDTSNSDFWIGQRGEGTDGGFFYGDLYDFRIYHEKVLSAGQVANLYTNKWTIATIPFGQVLFSNYSATTGTGLTRISKSVRYKWNVQAPPGSFTSASFTSTSFKTS